MTITNSPQTEPPLPSAPDTDADDDLPPDLANDANNYLKQKAVDLALLITFKKWIFGVGLVISCIFLGVGLWKSITFIGTQFELAKTTLSIQEKQLANDEKKLELLKDKKIKPDQIKTLNLAQDREEKVLDNKLLSTGVILTLITVIFAVALTIILNLIKHAFKTENENGASDKSELATPLGTLILEFIQVIKEKISK